MSQYLRPKAHGAAVFFTVALARRGDTLLTDQIDALRAAVRLTRARRPFGIAAWVVLPDHMHCLWQLPEGDADYATRIGAIKAEFVMGLRRAGFCLPMDLPLVRSGRYAGLKPGLRARKREVGLWQRRFWEHHIRNAADHAAHVQYCWANPVKHGFVERAVDWPYSSIHRDIRAGLVAPEWSGEVARGTYGEMA